MTAFNKYISNIQEQVRIHDNQQFATQILPIVREVKKAVTDNAGTISKYKVIEKEFENYINANASNITSLSQVSHKIGFTAKKIDELQKQIDENDTLLVMVSSETSSYFWNNYNSILNKVPELNIANVQPTIDLLKRQYNEISKGEDDLQITIQNEKRRREAEAKAEIERKKKEEEGRLRQEKLKREKEERERQEAQQKLIKGIFIFLGVCIGIWIFVAYILPFILVWWWLILIVIGVIVYKVFKDS